MKKVKIRKGRTVITLELPKDEDHDREFMEMGYTNYEIITITND